MRRSSILIAAILVPLLIPAVPAASIFTEGWENGGAGWSMASTTPGLSINCGWAMSGCSLASNIHCCGSHSATRALDIPLSSAATTIIKVRFYTNLTANDAWPWIEVQFDQGNVRLWLNHDQAETFRLQTEYAIQDFTGRYDRFEWYEAQILLRGENVMARLLGASGQARGDSAVFPIAGATRITSITIGNTYYPNSQGRDTPYFFDDLQIVDTPACFPFTPTLGVAVPVREYPMDPGFTLGLVGGHVSCPTTWSFDFGDGTSTGGSGTPPTQLPHTYTAAGTYTATFSVTEAGETRTASRLVTSRECDPLSSSLSALFSEGPAPFEAVLSTSTGSSLERCHATWRLDFGDGSPVLSGTGAAPVGISHTYTTPGVRTARFDVVRTTESGAATKILAAGPYEQYANGTIAIAFSSPSSSVNFFHQRVDLVAPADGSDTLTLRWNAPVPSDLDLYFTTGGARLAASGCIHEGTFGAESCVVPRGAESFVVTAKLAFQADWAVIVRYA